jgi:hypothetical protein
LEFSSPIPLEGTSTHHEYHYYPAMALERQAVERAAQSGYPDGVGTLLLFARDSAHEYGAKWQMVREMRGGVRLRQLSKETGEPIEVSSHVTVDPQSGFTCLLLNDLTEGTYLIGVRRRVGDYWYWSEMPVTVASSLWRTEVYLDCVEDEWTGRRFDLDSAAVLVVSATAESALDTSAARFTEVARIRLSEGRPEVDTAELDSPLTVSNPMLALYSAYALTFSPSPDLEEILRLCEALQEGWSRNSADVKILERWASAKFSGQNATEELVLNRDEVPMLSRGWGLLRELGSSVRLSLNSQYSVGMWRVSSLLWIQLMLPDRAVIPSWNEVKDELAATSTDAIRIQDDDQPLERIASALSRPNPVQSPIQQTLRRAILDARESGEPSLLNDIVANTANSLGLDQAIVSWALDRLLLRAAIGMLGNYGKTIAASITNRIGLEAIDAGRELVASVDDIEEEPPESMTSSS